MASGPAAQRFDRSVAHCDQHQIRRPKEETGADHAVIMRRISLGPPTLRARLMQVERASTAYR